MMSSECNNSSSASYEVGGKSSSIKKEKSSNEKRKCGRSDPIDESEQEKIISKLRQDAERQANTGRTTTFYLFRTIAGLFTAAMFYTIAYPYEIDHQNFYMESVPLWSIGLYYFFSLVNFICASNIVKYGFRRRAFIKNYQFLISLVIGVFSAVFWISVMISRKDSVTVQLYHFWLPSANLIGLLLAVYVDRDANILLKDAETMEGSKYSFKEI